MKQDRNKVQQNVSHDIRQPLNIILMVSDNIHSRLVNKLEEDDALYLSKKIGRIEDQISKIVALVENLSPSNLGR